MFTLRSILKFLLAATTLAIWKSFKTCSETGHMQCMLALSDKATLAGAKMVTVRVVPGPEAQAVERRIQERPADTAYTSEALKS